MQLHRAKSDFEAAGVDLVLIGQATPRQAAAFREKQDIDLPLLADEKRETYALAGAKVATATELLGPSSVLSGVAKGVKSGGKVRQGKVIGHPAQLGGVLLVAPGGAVIWSHLSENAGDNASPDQILEAARAAAS